jgi:hypothetical protein
MNPKDRKTLQTLRKLRSDRLNLAEHRLATARHDARQAAAEEASTNQARERMQSESVERTAELNVELAQGKGFGRSRIVQWRKDRDRLRDELTAMDRKVEQVAETRKARDAAAEDAQIWYRDQARDLERLLLLLDRAAPRQNFQ